MSTLRLALLAGTAISVLAWTAAARADVVTGLFTSDHCGGGGANGCLVGQTNGGSVSVTGSATAVDSNTLGSLTFSVNLANGNQFINGGFQASFGFNLDSSISSITYTSISPLANYAIPPGTTSPTLPTTQTAGSLMMDGTGSFTYGLEGIGNGGSDLLGSTLNFTITANGLDLLDLKKNAQGQFVAADIISFTAPGNPRTGAIDVSSGLTPGQQCATPPCDTVVVPEPSSLLSLATPLGVVAVGGVLYRRRRSNLRA